MYFNLILIFGLLKAYIHSIFLVSFFFLFSILKLVTQLGIALFMLMVWINQQMFKV